LPSCAGIEATRFAQLYPYCLRPHGAHTLADTAACEDALDVNEARNRARDLDMAGEPGARLWPSRPETNTP
jgi:hypothetical protein